MTKSNDGSWVANPDRKYIHWTVIEKMILAGWLTPESLMIHRPYSNEVLDMNLMTGGHPPHWGPLGSGENKWLSLHWIDWGDVRRSITTKQRNSRIMQVYKAMRKMGYWEELDDEYLPQG